MARTIAWSLLGLSLSGGCGLLVNYDGYDPKKGGGGAGAGGSGGGACSSPSDCDSPSNECEEPTCEQGACGTRPVEAKTPTKSQSAGDCQMLVCDGKGIVASEVDDSDSDDDNPCTADTCEDGRPSHVARSEGCPAGEVCAPKEGGETGCCKPEAVSVTCGDQNCSDAPASPILDNCGQTVLCGHCNEGSCSTISHECLCTEHPCGLWSRLFGDEADQAPVGVAVDADGNILITGYYSGTLILDAFTLTSTSDADKNVFVAKLDRGGRTVWAKGFGDQFEQIGRAIAAGPDNSVYVVGDASGSVDFGAGAEAAADKDAFLVKLDADGNYAWGGFLGGSDDEAAFTVAVEKGTGKVYVGGSYSGTPNLGDGALPDSGASANVFVAKFDGESGVTDWSIGFGTDSVAGVTAIAANPDGGVFVAGYFKGTMAVGTKMVTSTASANDAFLLKLAPGDGNCIFANRYGGSSQELPSALVVDDALVYMGGSYQGQPAFGNFTLEDVNLSFGVFLGGFSRVDGSTQWARGFTGGSDGLEGMALAGMNDLVLTGFFLGQIHFDDTTLSTDGSLQNDVFLVRAARDDGEVRWAEQYGSKIDPQAPAGVAVDAFGDILLVGNAVGGPFSFGGSGALVANAKNDLFVAKLAP